MADVMPGLGHSFGLTHFSKNGNIPTGLAIVTDKTGRVIFVGPVGNIREEHIDNGNLVQLSPVTYDKVAQLARGQDADREDGMTALYTRAKKLVTRFERATRQHEMKGSYEPSSRVEIMKEHKAAREALLLFLLRNLGNKVKEPT